MEVIFPTRLARHGKVLSRNGDFSMKRAEWATADEPIDPECVCVACRRYSRGYLRHLFATREFIGPRLLSLHNLTYTLDLMAGIRGAIAAGTYSEFRESVVAARGKGD